MFAPAFLPELLEEWNLTVVDQLEQGWGSYVVGVETEDGSSAVLKFIDVESDPFFINEVHAIRLMQGPFMVTLIRSDEARGAMLLERLSPAQTLSSLAGEDDTAATSIAAGIMLGLRRSVPTSPTFRTTETIFEDFAALNFKDSPLPVDLLSRARSVFSDLVESQSDLPIFLLHGDLHHGNILSSGTDSWRAIDPDPTVADAAYEAAAFMRNPFDQFAEIERLDRFLQRRADQLSEQMECDRDRLKAWAFARAALSVAWKWTDDAEVHEPWLACTEALRV